jgi:hypothetical protein
MGGEKKRSRVCGTGDGRKEKTVKRDGYMRASIRGEVDLNVLR